jgi:hypothetical protein
MKYPSLAKSTPTISPSKVSFELIGVPPNWLNWSRGLKERIALRSAWKDMTWTGALITRNLAGWDPARPGEKRLVTITVYRVKTLDVGDGLPASVAPVINGLKAVQFTRTGIGGKHTLRIMGPGLIFDDDPRHVSVSVKQVAVSHYNDEKTVVEVSRDESL